MLISPPTVLYITQVLPAEKLLKSLQSVGPKPQSGGSTVDKIKEKTKVDPHDNLSESPSSSKTPALEQIQTAVGVEAASILAGLVTHCLGLLRSNLIPSPFTPRTKSATVDSNCEDDELEFDLAEEEDMHSDNDSDLCLSNHNMLKEYFLSLQELANSMGEHTSKTQVLDGADGSDDESQQHGKRNGSKKKNVDATTAENTDSNDVMKETAESKADQKEDNNADEQDDYDEYFGASSTSAVADKEKEVVPPISSVVDVTGQKRKASPQSADHATTKGKKGKNESKKKKSTNDTVLDTGKDADCTAESKEEEENISVTKTMKKTKIDPNEPDYSKAARRLRVFGQIVFHCCELLLVSIHFIFIYFYSANVIFSYILFLLK